MQRKNRNIDANAFAVLLGRVLELVCVDRNAVGNSLHKKLQDLATKGEIPAKLVDVAQASRNAKRGVRMPLSGILHPMRYRLLRISPEQFLSMSIALRFWQPKLLHAWQHCAKGETTLRHSSSACSLQPCNLKDALNSLSGLLVLEGHNHSRALRTTVLRRLKQRGKLEPESVLLRLDSAKSPRCHTAGTRLRNSAISSVRSSGLSAMPGHGGVAV